MDDGAEVVLAAVDVLEDWVNSYLLVLRDDKFVTDSVVDGISGDDEGLTILVRVNVDDGRESPDLLNEKISLESAEIASVDGVTKIVVIVVGNMEGGAEKGLGISESTTPTMGPSRSMSDSGQANSSG